MKARIAAAILLCAAGCSPRESLEPAKYAGAACVGLAMATLAADAAPPEVPQKCCGKCGQGGLPPGKVRSGDGVAIIDCGCDPKCKCKQPRQAAPQPAQRAAAAQPSPQCVNGRCVK